MRQELKTCRNCEGKCDPNGWMRGDGLQGPECEGCGITTPDVESWNRLMGGQVASQGGEAVSVIRIPDPSDCYGFGYVDGTCIQSLRGARDHLEEILDQLPSEPLMTVAQHQRIIAAANHPADQVEDDLAMVKVSRELLQDLRDLAFDQVEHHHAAMGAYKQTRQSAMDSVLAQADALLAKP